MIVRWRESDYCRKTDGAACLLVEAKEMVAENFAESGGVLDLSAGL